MREANDFEAALDAAEVAYDFACAVAKSVEQLTSALQTQAGMVKIAYGLARRGRDSWCRSVFSTTGAMARVAVFRLRPFEEHASRRLEARQPPDRHRFGRWHHERVMRNNTDDIEMSTPAIEELGTLTTGRH